MSTDYSKSDTSNDSPSLGSMNLTPDLPKIKKKTVHTLNQDGVLDISLGLIFLFIGIIFLVDSVFNYEIPYGGMLVVLPFILISGEIRKRITFRRLGYVDMHSTRHLSFAIAIIFGIVLVLLILKDIFSIRVEYFRIIPFAILAVLAVCFFIFAQRYDLKRYIYYSLAPLFGIVILLLPFSRLKLRFLFSLLLIGVCMLAVGFVTLQRFKKDNPILSDDPDVQKDIKVKNKGSRLFLQDGLNEIFLALNLAAWFVIFLVFKTIPSFWLCFLLVIPPVLFGLLSLYMRKRYSAIHLEQNKVTTYVVNMSAVRNFAVMFCVNFIGFEVVTNVGLVDFFKPGSMWTSALIFAGLGCYYCIIALKYRLPQLLHIGIISFLCLFLYFLHTTPLSRLIIYAAIMALILCVNGIILRIKFPQNFKTEEVPDGK